MCHIYQDTWGYLLRHFDAQVLIFWFANDKDLRSWPEIKVCQRVEKCGETDTKSKVDKTFSEDVAFTIIVFSNHIKSGTAEPEINAE